MRKDLHEYCEMLAFLSASDVRFPLFFLWPIPKQFCRNRLGDDRRPVGNSFFAICFSFHREIGGLCGRLRRTGGVSVCCVRASARRPGAFSAWTTRIGFGKKSPREGVTL